MLNRTRRAVQIIRNAKKNPIVKAGNLGAMLDELDASLVEQIHAIETIAASVYLVARQVKIPAADLVEIRAIADPEKTLEVTR